MALIPLLTSGGGGGTSATIGLATETDEALALTATVATSIGIATDTETALPLTVTSFAGGASWFDTATLIVEFGWGESQTAEAITWTDESELVRAIDIRRGRGTEYDFMPAGECRLTLANADRRFDPTHTGGALYGDIVPGTQVRVRYSYGGTTYYLFRGQVEAFTQGWSKETQSYATCEVIAADARAFLASRTMLDCPLAVEIAADEPLHWWRLGEQDGTQARDHGSVGAHGTHAGQGTYNFRVGLANSAVDGAIEFVDGTSDSIALSSLTLTPPFTVTAQIVLRELDRRNPIMSIAGTGSQSFVFEVTSGNFLKVTYNDGTDERSSTGTALGLLADTVYTVSCVVLANAAPRLYLDTTAETLSSSGSGTLGAITGTGYLGRAGSDYAKLVLDEVTVFDSDKESEAGVTGGGSTRLDDYFDARRDAWDEDEWGGSLSRFTKVLRSVGWDLGRTDITNYSPALVFGPADLGENNAAAYLDEVANSEGGTWFASARGDVVAHDRLTRANLATSTSSQATISDDPAEALQYMGISADGTSKQWIRNRVRQRRPYGSVQEAKDATSIAAYGELIDDLGSSMLRTDADVATRVAARLATRKDAKQRFTSVVWSPRSNAATYPHAALEIGNRVTVERTPQSVGSQMSTDCFIEGVEHQISADGQWIVTWRLSPA